MKGKLPRLLIYLAILSAYTGAVATLDHGWHAGAFAYSAPLDEGLVALRALAWPGLVAGRLGFTHTWIMIALTLVGVFLLEKRILSAKVGAMTWRFAALLAVPLAGYCLIGLLYLFVLPIPQPAYSEFDLPGASAQASHDFHVGFDAGYRRGMIDSWDFPEGSFPPGFGTGITRGYFHGVREWRSLLPGITVSRSMILPNKKRDFTPKSPDDPG